MWVWRGVVPERDRAYVGVWVVVFRLVVPPRAFTPRMAKWTLVWCYVCECCSISIDFFGLMGQIFDFGISAPVAVVRRRAPAGVLCGVGGAHALRF